MSDVSRCVKVNKSLTHTILIRYYGVLKRAHAEKMIEIITNLG